MKKLIALTLTVLLTLSLSACGQTTYEPEAIDETVDICPICKMSVADDQYATQIVLKSHKSLKFDDLGDLFVWKQENGTDNIGEQFVRDFNSKEWIKLSDATYVYDKSIRTPMAFNVISFKEMADAEKYIAEAGVGVIMTASQLDDHKWEMNEDMMKEMMEEHMSEHMGDDMGDAHGEEDSSSSESAHSTESSGTGH